MRVAFIRHFDKGIAGRSIDDIVLNSADNPVISDIHRNMTRYWGILIDM